MKRIKLFIKKIYKKRLDPDIVRDAIIDYRKDGKKLMERLGKSMSWILLLMKNIKSLLREEANLLIEKVPYRNVGITHFMGMNVISTIRNINKQ